MVATGLALNGTKIISILLCRNEAMRILTGFLLCQETHTLIKIRVTMMQDVGRDLFQLALAQDQTHLRMFMVVLKPKQASMTNLRCRWTR